MTRGIRTTVIGSRIPDQLVPTLQKLADDRGVTPSTLAKTVLLKFINDQTIKNPTAR